MLRIVMGLGTKAVDRTKEDYPRLANLDRPTVTVMTTVEQKHKFSQRYIDVLDCQENRLTEVPMEKLLPVLPLWYKKRYWNMIMMRKTDSIRWDGTEMYGSSAARNCWKKKYSPV